MREGRAKGREEGRGGLSFVRERREDAARARPRAARTAEREPAVELDEERVEGEGGFVLALVLVLLVVFY